MSSTSTNHLLRRTPPQPRAPALVRRHCPLGQYPHTSAPPLGEEKSLSAGRMNLGWAWAGRVGEARVLTRWQGRGRSGGGGWEEEEGESLGGRPQAGPLLRRRAL